MNSHDYEPILSTTTKEHKLADDVVTAYMASIGSKLPLPVAVARALLAMGWDKMPKDEISDYGVMQ